MSHRPVEAVTFKNPGAVGETVHDARLLQRESKAQLLEDTAGHIVLVDKRNRAIGSADKELVHRTGLLHRAFSVFLMDDDGRILLQRRSPAKYHSGGLWANSCCGHPLPGERTLAAARRRTFEELGIRVELSFGFHARYSSVLDNGMVENEFVYVYRGHVNGGVAPNPDELDALQYLSVSETDALIRERPGDFACWLRHYFSAHLPALQQMSVVPAAGTR